MSVIFQNYTWMLKINKVGDDYKFTSGWEELKDHLIHCDGIIMFFELTAPTVFHLRLFFSHGVELTITKPQVYSLFIFIFYKI